MSISEQVKELREYVSAYETQPFGREVKGTVRVLSDAADTIESLSAKLSAVNMERSGMYYNGDWIPCSERLPEESLESVIGWDEYRERCCFVQYWDGRWIFGNDADSVNIIAWMPLPEPYKPHSLN